MRSRNERRRLRHEVGALSENARKVREELFACEAHFLEVDQFPNRSDEVRASNDSLRGEVLRGIESYVDALGKLVDVDDKMTSFAFEDDEPFHELLVRHRWLGAETVERAKRALEDEVARRSVGKSDLALLLSSVDRTAFLLYGQMPDVFKNLHGEELVGEIVKSLMDEEFTKTLMGDTQWAEMRRRWVRLGWRTTTEETFNAAFIRAAAERVVEIHDGKDDNAARGGFAVDTILDEALQEEKQATRDQMIEAFRLRLEREYDALPRRYAANKTAEIDVTFNSKEIKALDRIADEWDTSRSGAMERIVQERLAGIQRDKPGLAATPLPKETLVEPYSDHRLMRQGRVAWEATYAKGMTDEELKNKIGALNMQTDLHDDLVLFVAKWAVHAFQRLMTSHTFAAALMCSDVQREVLVGIEQQWDAFLVIVPNGMLVADQFEFTRIMVASYSFGAQMILMAPYAIGKSATLTDRGSTLMDLLVSDESDLQQESVAQRCLVMAKRLVAGLLLNLQDAGTHKVRKVDARPKSKNREAEPEHRIVTIGEPIEIDCRGAVKEYIEHGTRSSENGHRRHGAPTVQWMVRGHFRMQAHGPKHTLRRKTWIRPHWQGHEAALIQTRASKVAPP